MTTTQNPVHMIDPKDVQQVSPQGASPTWVVSRTCGGYTCKPQKFPESARRELYRHVRAATARAYQVQKAEAFAQNPPGHDLRSGLQAIIDEPGPVTKASLVSLLSAYPEEAAATPVS